MFKKLRFSKKASIEIGINTIVIMVIAIVLLGLGVAFVKGIFNKMSGLTDTISIDDMTSPPTSSDPLKINPSKMEIKSGKGKQVKIGVYNKYNEAIFSVSIGECTGISNSDGTPVTATPSIITIEQKIPSGEAKAFRTTLYAKKDDGTNMIPGDYVCPLSSTKDSDTEATYTTQFYLTVTS